MLLFYSQININAHTADQIWKAQTCLLHVRVFLVSQASTF